MTGPASLEGADKRLRVEQRKDEPADLWALRALSMALPHMDDNQRIAMARWLWARVNDDLRKRGFTIDRPFSRVAA